MSTEHPDDALIESVRDREVAQEAARWEREGIAPRRRLADDLADTSYLRAEIDRLREKAFQKESDAHKHRAQADALELDLVERQSAANLIREIGLTVGRNKSGVPWVKVERTVAPVEPT